jgi:hypothetical protein
MRGRFRFFDVYSPIEYKKWAAFIALRGDLLERKFW